MFLDANKERRQGAQTAMQCTALALSHFLTCLTPSGAEMSERNGMLWWKGGGDRR